MSISECIGGLVVVVVVVAVSGCFVCLVLVFI